MPKFRAEMLFPVFYQNTKEVFLCTFENLSFPFGNAFLLLGLPVFSKAGSSGKKHFIFAAAVAGVFTILMGFQDLLLLGGELASVLDFPYNFSTSLVNVSDFFSRLEVFASLFFFLSAIVRGSYFMKLTVRGIQSLVKVSSDTVALPLVATLFSYSLFAFANTNDVFHYLAVFPYLAAPLQFCFPLVLWIVAEIKAKPGRVAGIKMKKTRML